jgi:predicted nucleic acid-binding Zn ribbon protein
MKISSDRPLGEVIKELIETYNLEGKLNELKVIHSWEKVVGEMIARHTKDLYIKNGKLFVKIDSPALKNELTYSSSTIVENLNTEAGCKVIEEVIFI